MATFEPRPEAIQLITPRHGGSSLHPRTAPNGRGWHNSTTQDTELDGSRDVMRPIYVCQDKVYISAREARC